MISFVRNCWKPLANLVQQQLIVRDGIFFDNDNGLVQFVYLASSTTKLNKNAITRETK
jgi:hypothetical protein